MLSTSNKGLISFGWKTLDLDLLETIFQKVEFPHISFYFSEIGTLKLEIKFSKKFMNEEGWRVKKFSYFNS